MASAEPTEGRCAALIRKGPDAGKFCEKQPMKAQTRCGSHGGRAPQNVAAAERRMVEAAGRAYVAKYADPDAHIEWHEAIPLGIDEAYSNLLAMRQLVQSLAPEQLAWGQTEVVEILGSQFPGVNTTHAAGIHPWVQMYGEERDRLHKQAVDAGKLNLDVRRQTFAERDGNVVAEVLRGSLIDLDALLQSGELTTVDPSHPRVVAVLGTRLRALTAGAA